MNTALYGILAVAAIVALYFILRPLIGIYRRYRGARVITCPETKAPAGVEVDAMQAAISSFTQPNLRLKDCSRWPEKQNCGQECLSQIESAPEDCLVRNLLTNWYKDKQCVSCGKLLGEIDWLERKPALMGPGQDTIDWQKIQPEQVPDVLNTHKPVCWDCHIAATFRREHPDLVVDRSWKKQ